MVGSSGLIIKKDDQLQQIKEISYRYNTQNTANHSANDGDARFTFGVKVGDELANQSIVV